MIAKRYIIKQDSDAEQYKIIDMQSALGTEDKDWEWVCSVYDLKYAVHIMNLLNQNPPSTN